jgi:hypothetical protein
MGTNSTLMKWGGGDGDCGWARLRTRDDEGDCDDADGDAPSVARLGARALAAAAAARADGSCGGGDAASVERLGARALAVPREDGGRAGGDALSVARLGARDLSSCLAATLARPATDEGRGPPTWAAWEMAEGQQVHVGEVGSSSAVGGQRCAAGGWPTRTEGGGRDASAAASAARDAAVGGPRVAAGEQLGLQRSWSWPWSSSCFSSRARCW